MRTDAHRWLGCVGFSHGIHRIHRSFWQRRASHGFHRCAQMVRLRRLLWEDSSVAAWVWQGCHTLLICAHLCNLWENILRQKLLWVLWLLWEDSLVVAWVWQDAIPSYSLHCLLCWCSGDSCTPLKEIAAKKFVGLSLFYYFCTKQLDTTPSHTIDLIQ